MLENQHYSSSGTRKSVKIAEYAFTTVHPQLAFYQKREMIIMFSSRRTPLESVSLLNKELELYDPKLVRKPAICILNKADTLDEKQKKEISLLISSLGTQKWADDVPEDLRPKTPINSSMLSNSVLKVRNRRIQKILTLMRHHLHTLSDAKKIRRIVEQ
ncbi:hypothetical protein B9Z55_028455 [Caenorhabditis nigoni]|uniref:Uncharacterized protein n=1 Tax=Caenorhabditis nigoni TaxID=1611254 RepID=A0A2G5SC21_9PELO|nr:hypothetical protein B9Z55_028455 [Caenorhabditis nigoni]